MVLFPSRGVTCCRAHRMWCMKWLKTREGGALQRRGIFSDKVCVNFMFLWCSLPHCSLEKTASPDSSDKMNLVWEETKALRQKWNTNRMQMCPRTKHNGRRLLLLWDFCSCTPLCSLSGFISSAVQYCFSRACHSGICNPAWSAGVYRNKGFKTAVGSSQVFYISPFESSIYWHYLQDRISRLNLSQAKNLFFSIQIHNFVFCMCDEHEYTFAAQWDQVKDAFLAEYDFSVVAFKHLQLIVEWDVLSNKYEITGGLQVMPVPCKSSYNRNVF